MSAMRLSTLIAAITATLALVLSYILEAVANADLVPEPVALLASVTVIVTWLGFFCAHCRDTVIEDSTKKAADILDAINTAVTEAGDQRATEARLDTIAAFNQVPPQGRPARMHPVN